MKQLSLLALIFVFTFASAEVSPAIVGGRNASLGQFPYMVSIQERGDREMHVCGGGILNSRWILTAAHCFDENYLRIPVAVIGTIDRIVGGVVHEIEKVLKHPEYTRFYAFAITMLNDIALMKTSLPMSFNAFTQPIPLGRRAMTGNEPATMAGFGMYLPNITVEWEPDMSHMSRQLRFLETRLLSHTECSLRAGLHMIRYPFHPQRRIINPFHDLCSLQPNGIGACFGDSGSMLIANGEVVGVVSSGVRVCGQGAPDIYVRVSAYVNWIDMNIQS